MVSKGKMPCGRDQWCGGWYCNFCCVDGAHHSPEDPPAALNTVAEDADAGSGETSGAGDLPNTYGSRGGTIFSSSSKGLQEEAPELAAELTDLKRNILEVAGATHGPEFILTSEEVRGLMMGGEQLTARFSSFQDCRRPPEPTPFCSSYDQRTKRCTVDGSTYCAFPTSTWCPECPVDPKRLREKMNRIRMEVENKR